MTWNEYKQSAAFERAKNRLKRDLTHQGFQGWRDAKTLASLIGQALTDAAQAKAMTPSGISVEHADAKVRVRTPLTVLPPVMQELKQGRWISVFMALDWLAGIVAWRDVLNAASHAEELARAERLLDHGWALVHKRPGKRFTASFIAMDESLPDLVWQFLTRIDQGRLALEDARRGDYFIAPVIDFDWPALPDTSISLEAVARQDPVRYILADDEAMLRLATAELADTESTAALARWVQANWGRQPQVAVDLREVEERWRRWKQRRAHELREDRPLTGTQRELFGVGIRLSI